MKDLEFKDKDLWIHFSVETTEYFAERNTRDCAKHGEQYTKRATDLG